MPPSDNNSQVRKRNLGSVPAQKRSSSTPKKKSSANLKRSSVATRRKKRKKTGLSLEWKLGIVCVALVLLSPLYYGYVARVFSSTWRWVSDWGEDPNYRTYSSFDIRIPKEYTLHGIDVSYYQGKIDWKMVKAMQEDQVRVHFAFIKATEGVLSVDPYFQRNWREAPKAGIVCGAYHYFKAKKSGKWQAKFFLQTVKFEQGDLPPVVDVEELNGVSAEKMRAQLHEYLDFIEETTAVKPMIYSGLSFYNDYLKGHFDGYPLWLAHYHQAELKVSDSTVWHFWQHSDRAKISGIGHVVDFNVFQGDSLAFEQMRLP